MRKSPLSENNIGLSTLLYIGSHRYKSKHFYLDISRSMCYNQNTMRIPLSASPTVIGGKWRLYQYFEVNNMELNNISFGKLKYCENEGEGTVVRYYTDVREREYFTYLDTLGDFGYQKREEYSIGPSRVSLFAKDDDMLLCNYFPTVNEARIVTEPSSEYLLFSDPTSASRVNAMMTQIDLEDFGTSVVFRLPDGRFIVFDGGWGFEPDADKLVKCLADQSDGKTPTVAAWIITHPHCDHYRCFSTAYEKYQDAFKVERFIYNIADSDEKFYEAIPKLRDEEDELRKFYRCVKATGAKVYRAHTGQIYKFSGARLEVLASPDDTLVRPVNNMNHLSLIIKMTIVGQTIMMCADATLSVAGIAKRYGEYLKSDILQPAHHMFTGGDNETYDLIDPAVCVASGFEEHCFGNFSTCHRACRDANLHLLYNLNVQDFFTGGTGNVALTLPYTPRANGRRLYLDKLDKHRKALGAESWFFTELTKEDATFCFVNATYGAAEIYLDLYCENDSDQMYDDYVHAIKFTIPALSMRRFNVLDTDKVDGDALYYNPHSLSKKGVADGAVFSAHFRSSLPIVIKGKKNADYHS